MIIASLVVTPTSKAQLYGIESATVTDSVEFRGAMQLEGVWQFSLRDKATQSSFWLEMGRTTHGLTPIDYDSGTGILSVQYQGKDYQVKLIEAQETPLAVIESRTTYSDQKEGDEHYIPSTPDYTPPPPPNSGLPPSTRPPGTIPFQPASSTLL